MVIHCHGYNVPVTTSWQHKVLEINPAIYDLNQTKAMLAFYGIYNTGNIPHVKNVRLRIKPTLTDEQVVTNLTTESNGIVTIYANWRDNTAPTVTFNPNGATTPSTEASTKVTVVDPGSGPKESTFKYLWTTRTSGVTKADFTGTNSGTFTQGATIDFPANNSGDYYLYIYAEDNEGNPVVAKSNVFVAGNMQPGATVSASTAWNNTGTTITVSAYAIRVTYNNSNTRSEAHDTASVAKITVNGEEVTFSNGVGTYLAADNGTYRIEVTDKYGNIWSQDKAIGNVDMTGPTISANNITYLQDLSISMADVGSGIVGWQVTSSSTAPTSGWTTVSPAASSKTVTKSGLTAGTWYIWAIDGVGNTGSKQVTVYKKSTAITVTPPAVLTGGNSTSCTPSITPAISGTWNVTTSTDAVSITAGNGSTGSSTTIKYTGKQAGGETLITIKFTPSDSSYDVASAEYTQTVIAGNYSITSGSTKTYYNTMAVAVGAVANNGTATIVEEYDYTDTSSVTISNGKKITFNNNGKTLTKKTSRITVNSGTTLDVSGNGLITTDENINILNNSGTLTISHTGTISDTYTGNNRPIENNSILNKTGSGTITSSTKNSTIGNFGANAVMTVSAGIINNTNTNGAIHSANYNSILNIEGTAQITSSGSYGVTIGYDTDDSNGNGSGILNMTGGSISCASGQGINCWDHSTVNITGGTVTGGTKDGIYLATGTVNIGSTSTTFNTNNPVIQGETYGIRKSGGTWNFYNGILKGKTGDYTGGEPTNKRSGYDVKHDTEGAYKTAYLKLVPTLTLSASSVVIHDEQETVPITYTGDGSLSVSSSNSSVATGRIVGNNLVITGGNVGTATITVSASEGVSYLPKTATCTVTVNPATPIYRDRTVPVIYDGQAHGAVIEVEPSGLTLWYGTEKLTASNYNTKGSKTPITITNVGTKTVYYYIDASANANYNSVEPTGPATVTINRATMSPKPKAQVSDWTYADSTVPTPTVTGNIGGGTPTYYYYKSTESASQRKAWTTITSGTSLGAGDYYLVADIPATNYEAVTTDAYKFTVKRKKVNITVTPANLTVIAGNTATFTVTYTGDGNLSATSNKTNIATVSLSNKTGTVTGKAAGSATITVSASGETNYESTPVPCSVTVEAAIYQVSSGSPTYHRSLETAISSVAAGGTITVLTNATDGSAATISKNIDLQLNGKTLTRTATITVSSGKTFAVMGSGTLTTSSAIHLITNSGTVSQHDTGTMSNTNSGNYDVINSTSSAYVKKFGSGTITSSTTGKAINGGDVWVEDGTVNSTKGIAIETSKNFNMRVATISSSSGRAVSLTGGAASIPSGNIQKSGSGSGDALYYSGTDTVSIGSNATVQITSGSGNAVYNNSSGAINIQGGTVANNGSSNAIYNNGTGTVRVSYGTVTSKSAIGVVNNSTGTIEIGSSSMAHDYNNPIITGGTYGVQNNNGTAKFYNGKVRGKTAGYYNYPTKKPSTVRSGFVLANDAKTEDNVSYNILYLRKEVEVEPGKSETVSMDTTGGANTFNITTHPASAYASAEKASATSIKIKGASNASAGSTTMWVTDNLGGKTEIGINVVIVAVYPELKVYNSSSGTGTIGNGQSAGQIALNSTVTVYPTANCAGKWTLVSTSPTGKVSFDTQSSSNLSANTRFAAVAKGIGSSSSAVTVTWKFKPSDTEHFIDDESVNRVTYTHTVGTGSVTISGVPSGLQYVAEGSEKTVSATSNVPGTWTIKSSDTSKISITAGSSISNSTAGTFKYKGVSADADAATITVEFVPRSTDYTAPSNLTFTAKATTCTGPTTTVVLVNGNNTKVTLGGKNAGTFSITTSPNSSYATASVSGNELTITGKGVGNTSLVVKEENGNATTTVNITVQAANYSVKIGDGNTLYYSTLKSAADSIEDRTSNRLNATITVLNNVTESGNKVSFGKKNITFNTNGKQLTLGPNFRGIGCGYGDVTVSGNGKIIADENFTSSIFTLGYAMTFSTSGSPLISSASGYCIEFSEGYPDGAALNLNGGYIYSTKGIPISIEDPTGPFNINNTNVITEADCPAIECYSSTGNGGPSADLNISGTSKIGIGKEKYDEDGRRDILRLETEMNVTLSGNSGLYGGPGASCGIVCKKDCIVKVEGNSCIYMCKNTDTAESEPAEVTCIKTYTDNGSYITINTNSVLYTGGKYVVRRAQGSGFNLTYTKGKLGSRINKYMIYNNEASVQSSQSSPVSLDFIYYSNYNTSTTVTRTDCYSYSK